MIVTQGTASAYLQLQNGANIRLATFGRVLIRRSGRSSIGGPRTASVIADGDFVYAMSRDNYASLAEKSQGAAIQFMAAVGRELSGRLRTANRTIHELEA